MPVPKCKECEFCYEATIQKDKWFCKHQDANKKRMIKDIKTSPAWCPPRKAGDSNA
jgi:hypothetical protein